MGKKTAVTAAQAIAAVKGTGGIKTQIARKLGVNRRTVDNYLLRWITFRDAYLEEKSGIDDMAVSVVVNDIVKRKNVSTAKWWIERKLDEFNPKLKIEGTWLDKAVADGIPPDKADAIFNAHVDAMAETFFEDAG